MVWLAASVVLPRWAGQGIRGVLPERFCSAERGPGAADARSAVALCSSETSAMVSRLPAIGHLHDLTSFPQNPGHLRAFVTPGGVDAGGYGPQDFDGYPEGTQNLGDGTVISSNTGVCKVRGLGDRYLRLTQDGTEPRVPHSSCPTSIRTG